MGVRLDHIGIAVKSLDDASGTYEALLSIDAGQVRREENVEQKVRIAFIELPNCRIELLEPSAPDSPIAKFIESRGEGVYGIVLDTEDAPALAAKVKSEGLRVIEDAEGDNVIRVVHPRDFFGTLMMILQRAG